jgi:hypothetical protein
METLARSFRAAAKDLLGKAQDVESDFACQVTFIALTSVRLRTIQSKVSVPSPTGRRRCGMGLRPNLPSF